MRINVLAHINSASEVPPNVKTSWCFSTKIVTMEKAKMRTAVTSHWRSLKTAPLKS